MHAFVSSAQGLLDTGPIHGDVTAGVMYSTDARNHGVLIRPRWQPAFGIDLEAGRFYAGTDHGVGVKAIATGSLTLGVGADFRPGRYESADAAYRGLGSIRGEPVATSYFEWTPVGPALTIYGDFSIAAKGPHETTYTAGARGGLPIVEGVTAFVDASLAGADTRYVQAFYGISASQAATRGRRSYATHAGPISNTVAAGLLFDVAKNLQVIASVGRFWYASGLARSPLVVRRSYPEALIATIYSF